MKPLTGELQSDCGLILLCWGSHQPHSVSTSFCHTKPSRSCFVVGFFRCLD
uniref:Uncharacterized protein n=1 Tax=Anguilla anguilla TaxID=7936 RepID=A0A0E9PWW3_ANGAN